MSVGSEETSRRRVEKMEKVRRALRRIRQSRGRREPVAQRRSFFARLKARLGLGGDERE